MTLHTARYFNTNSLFFYAIFLIPSTTRISYYIYGRRRVSVRTVTWTETALGEILRFACNYDFRSVHALFTSAFCKKTPQAFEVEQLEFCHARELSNGLNEIQHKCIFVVCLPDVSVVHFCSPHMHYYDFAYCGLYQCIELWINKIC